MGGEKIIDRLVIYPWHRNGRGRGRGAVENLDNWFYQLS